MRDIKTNVTIFLTSLNKFGTKKKNKLKYKIANYKLNYSAKELTVQT